MTITEKHWLPKSLCRSHCQPSQRCDEVREDLSFSNSDAAQTATNVLHAPVPSMRRWLYEVGLFLGGIIYTTILGLICCEVRSLCLKRKRRKVKQAYLQTQMVAGAVADTSDLFYDDLVTGSQKLKAYAIEAKQVRIAQRENRMEPRGEALGAPQLPKETQPVDLSHPIDSPVPKLNFNKTLSGRDRAFVQDPEYRKEQAQDYDVATTARLLEKLSSRRIAYEAATNAPGDASWPEELR